MAKTALNIKWKNGKHNHDECIENAFSIAEKLCEKKGIRFTPTRRLVLNLLWLQHSPVGAYELLNMAQERGYHAAPITIYRALDFLIDNGLAHRIASSNSFIGCSCGGGKHHALFLTCRKCGSIVEVDGTDFIKKFKKAVAESGFKIKNSSMEFEGLCPNCNK